MRCALFLLPLIFVSSANACMNDRDSDSLALQAQNFPDTLRVITGRFERNPPLYYEMRIRRSLKALQKNPRSFGLYDDIGVAYDRLHRDDAALQIMAKKRALLPRFDAKNAKLKEAWYRYYANAGTFHAHRFLGAKSQNIQEMQTARNFIKRAIEIKPNAHFGREKYQLMAMEWILALHERKGKNVFSLGRWIADRDKWEDATLAIKFPQRQQAVEGLNGLIVLGAAWESPDIFQALSDSLAYSDGVTLRYLALLRLREIFQNGKTSLNPLSLTVGGIEADLKYPNLTNIDVNDTNRKALDELFPKLRAEAESWNSKRQSYMLTRLQKGNHPDTDSKFWSDWKPAAPPSLEVDWFNEKQFKKNEREKAFSQGKTVKVAMVLFFAGVVLIWGLRLRAQARRYRSNFLQ